MRVRAEARVGDEMWNYPKKELEENKVPIRVALSVGELLVDQVRKEEERLIKKKVVRDGFG